MTIGFTLSTTIGKSARIAIYLRNDLFLTTGVQQALDTARRRSPHEYVEKVAKISESILTLEDKESIMKACDQYFHGTIKESLKSFFQDHPTCWPDLQRKVHKYVRLDSRGIYSIGQDESVQISRIFLIRDRKADSGPKIRTAIDSLLKNQEFLAFCSKQPSLLDSSGYSLAQIPNNKKRQTYTKYIRQALIQNIAGCDDSNIQEHYTQIYRKILKWIPLVYGEENGIYQELMSCDTIEKLAKKIADVMSNEKHSHYGRRRENAARILQAFFAWGNLEEIENLINKAQEAVKPENMIPVFKRMGITVNKEMITQKEDDGTILYEYPLQKNGKKFTLYWRAKTLLSILQKLAENEDYTNADSIRDLVGMSLIQEDSSGDSLNETVQIVKGVKQAMPNFGYITTNRTFFSEQQIQNIFTKGQSQKLPLDAKNVSNATTNPNLNNFSVSGFLEYGGEINALGSELQVLTREAYNWKKNEDGYFKGKGITELRMRASKFDTFRGLYRAFDKRIASSKLDRIRSYLGQDSRKPFRINELIMKYIDEGWLIPYVVNGALIFTNKEKEIFLNRWLAHGKFYKIQKHSEDSHKTEEKVSYKELMKYLQNFQL